MVRGESILAKKKKALLLGKEEACRQAVSYAIL